MKRSLAVLLSASLAMVYGLAQSRSYPKAMVSFEDFKQLVARVEAHRASHLIDLDTFLRMSQEPGVIVLDARSDLRFDRIHIRGASHLSFTDFTQANLSRVIPSLDTKVLIYCNNNFKGNQVDFATKASKPLPRFSANLPPPSPNARVTSQLAGQGKPIMLALNIPTYINLYGYGYRNVYELDELVDVKDPRIAFAGSVVEPKQPDFNLPFAPR
jgi:rhodanese-related sulfurtransferase